MGGRARHGRAARSRTRKRLARRASFSTSISPPNSVTIPWHTDEKLLKAFLVIHARTFRKTHSLEEVGRGATLKGVIIRTDRGLELLGSGGCSAECREQHVPLHGTTQ